MISVAIRAFDRGSFYEPPYWYDLTDYEATFPTEEEAEGYAAGILSDAWDRGVDLTANLQDEDTGFQRDAYYDGFALSLSEWER